MSENKCCGNCKHFKDEDAEGWGWCSFNKTKCHCAQSWDCHNGTHNGWTEITQDNVDTIYDEVLARVMVTDGKEIKPTLDWHLSMGTMAKYGGYWYYIVPEFRKEG